MSFRQSVHMKYDDIHRREFFHLSCFGIKGTHFGYVESRRNMGDILHEAVHKILITSRR
jgi:hypothetical protein